MGRKIRGVIRKNGKWMVRAYFDGKERTVRCDSQSQAAAVYQRMKVEHREGRLLPKAKPVPQVHFSDYCESWLKNQPAQGKKPGTFRVYEGRLRKHVLPAFGRSELSAITRPQVKDWAIRLLDVLDYDTVSNTVVTFGAVLSEAVEDGLIQTNPVLKSGKWLKRPKTLEEEELVIFTPEEQRTFLWTVQRERPSCYPMVLTFFRTGLRCGEVLALHRVDVDFMTHTLHVQRTWSYGRLGTPKNGRSRRVDMSQGLETVLKEWMELQALEAAVAGKPTPTVLFPGGIGGTRRAPSYMREDTLRNQVWFPLLEKAGVRRLDLHAARHTYASRLIQAGANLKYVSEQLGHSSIAITCDTYGHLVPGENRQIVNRLDEMGTITGTSVPA
jgi:integrase